MDRDKVVRRIAHLEEEIRVAAQAGEAAVVGHLLRKLLRVRAADAEARAKGG